MQGFACERCASGIRFDTMRCPHCEAPQGYVPGLQTLRALTAGDDGVSFTTVGHATTWWRCLNAAWGCNWVLPAATGATWCLSCSLTRGRPDEARPDAIGAWAVAEAAKRRLVHQLLRLGLPVEGRSPATPNGLTFDLVYLPGEGGLTGHLDGVVTLDLAEADERHREELRRLLAEPFRTVIGTLRHEVGHHYWPRLVGQSDDLVAARSLFGDERGDYTGALERYYATVDTVWDATRFVSRYASAHPLEDWAETFAHYLHIVDATETAAVHGLVTGAEIGGDLGIPRDGTFRDLLHRWRPVAAAIDAVAEAVGSPSPYPVRPEGAAVDKLDFVHTCMIEHRRRGRFYAGGAARRDVP